MKQIMLSNGVQMPMEGFGVFQIPNDACEAVVLTALKTGYRLIDTASSYQNEKAVGDAIRKSGIPREELFITSKAYIQEMGYEKTKLAFERSLKNLGLDYLDLYLIHMPFGDYYGAWRAMEELYEQGKIRAVGICNFLPDRLLDLCKNVRIRPMINQIEHHPHDQRDEEIALMKKLGVQPEAFRQAAPYHQCFTHVFPLPHSGRPSPKLCPGMSQLYKGACAQPALPPCAGPDARLGRWPDGSRRPRDAWGARGRRRA